MLKRELGPSTYRVEVSSVNNME